MTKLFKFIYEEHDGDKQETHDMAVFAEDMAEAKKKATAYIKDIWGDISAKAEDEPEDNVVFADGNGWRVRDGEILVRWLDHTFEETTEAAFKEELFKRHVIG